MPITLSISSRAPAGDKFLTADAAISQTARAQRGPAIAANVAKLPQMLRKPQIAKEKPRRSRDRGLVRQHLDLVY